MNNSIGQKKKLVPMGLTNDTVTCGLSAHGRSTVSVLTYLALFFSTSGFFQCIQKIARTLPELEL